MPEADPVTRYRMETADPEQAHAWFREFYADHDPRLSGDRESFRMSLCGMAMDELRVDEVQHSMAMDADSEPCHSVIVVRARGGHFWMERSGAPHEPGFDGLVLMDPYRQIRNGWDNGDLQVVRLELGRVRAVAEEISGVPADRIRFGLSVPVDEPRARFWTRTVTHVVRDVLARDEVAAQPLVRATAVRMLAAAAVGAFPNTALEALSDRPARGTRYAHPAVVRRAVAFIENAAHRDIGTVEIAEAARIGVRGLQHAFRKHLECTPLEYLKRVRMEGAHGDLRTGDPTRGDTVSAVAARWGFTHPGRFSVEYRRTYGCSPRHTLHH